MDAARNDAAFSSVTPARSELSRVAGRARGLVTLLILAGGVSGCSKLKARDQLNKGVADFKNGQYDSAIEHFKQDKEADSTLMNARLYLATAYASQYIPGAPSAENQARGNQGVAEFKEVLDIGLNNVSAIDGSGSILFQMAGTPFDEKKFEESKTYHQRHFQLRPQDPDPYYWIAVIDWTRCYRVNGELRLEDNKNNLKKQVKDTDPLPASMRAEYVAKCGALVDEGIAALQKALEIKPDYDAAMGYLSLIYRRKAGMVETADQRASLDNQPAHLLHLLK